MFSTLFIETCGHINAEFGRDGREPVFLRNAEESKVGGYSIKPVVDVVK